MGQNSVLSLIKDGPVCPLQREIIKEALALISLVFREYEQLLSWLLLQNVEPYSPVAGSQPASDWIEPLTQSGF